MSRNQLVPQFALQRRPLVRATAPRAEVLDISGNAEPSSCAVCVPDTSFSMEFSSEKPESPASRPIDRLNEGLQTLREEINADEIMAEYCELAIVQCGEQVKLVREFTPVGRFDPPVFRASGCTPLAESLLFAADLIEEWQATKTRADVDFCKPFVLAITDGRPTDKYDVIQAASKRVRELESQGRVAFFVAYTGSTACPQRLRELVVREPRPLSDFNYTAVFRWFAATMGEMTRSVPGESYVIPNPVDYGWDNM